MKWTAVANGQKFVLQQDLLHLNVAEIPDYSYMTRPEIEALITVAHKGGTELTFHRDEGEEEAGLYEDDGRGDCITITILGEEIDPALYMIVLD